MVKKRPRAPRSSTDSVTVPTFLQGVLKARTVRSPRAHGSGNTLQRRSHARTDTVCHASLRNNWLMICRHPVPLFTPVRQLSTPSRRELVESRASIDEDVGWV